MIVIRFLNCWGGGHVVGVRANDPPPIPLCQECEKKLNGEGVASA